MAEGICDEIADSSTHHLSIQPSHHFSSVARLREESFDAPDGTDIHGLDAERTPLWPFPPPSPCCVFLRNEALCIWMLTVGTVQSCSCLTALLLALNCVVGDAMSQRKIATR